MSRRRSRKPCPVCGGDGTGPYPRWVLNSQKHRYEPYLYFSHKAEGRQTWCYVRKPKLSNEGTLEARASSPRLLENGSR